MVKSVIKYVRKKGYYGRRKKRNIRIHKMYGKPIRRQLPIAFPEKYTCILKYVDEVQFNAPAAGLAGTYVFRANSIFDPNYTGGGHQPLATDTLTTIYTKFTVIGSRIRVRVSPSGEGGYASGPMAYFGVIISDTGNEYAGMPINEILENEKHSAIKQYGYNGAVDPYFKGITKNWSFKKQYGKKADILNADYQCTAGSGPSEVTYFEVFGCGVASQDPLTVTLLVELEYIVVCMDHKYMTSS